MPNGKLNGRNFEDGEGNGSKERQGDGKPSESLVVGLQATSGHGKSDVEASFKRKMSPTSRSSLRRQNARSYRAWQKNMKKNSNVTDKSPSERLTFNAHNNMPLDQIVNSGARTKGTEEDSAARSRCSKECTTSLNGGENFGNAEGNKMRYCNGKGCKASCGVIDDLPFGWHCSSCVRKKMLYGVHSVSEGVESIWNAQQVDTFDKYGSLQVQRQYFVKYKGLAHVHNRWEAESKLLVEAPSLVAKFSQRNQESTWQRDWMVLDRVLHRRTLSSSLEHEKDPHFLSNCQHEWLVKWRGLGYEHATWELENSSFLCCLHGQVLIQDYYTRCKKEPGGKSPLKALSQFPGGCSSDIELDKYIDFVEKLQQYKNQNAIIFDKARIVKIISFVRYFSSDVYRPILIISTSTTLLSWEKEFLSLAKSVNVVVYSENRKIREHIRKLEFYRENGLIMFQVLLTSPEVVIEDLEVLACIGWEVIVVDECQCSKVSSCLEQIKILHTGMRLLVASSQLKCSIPEYINVLSFLDSDGNSNSTTIGSLDTKFIISKLKERLVGYVAYDSETKSCRFVEYWVPAVMSNVQLELYCDTLLSNSLFLCSSSKSDSVGTLGNLLISLQKCCDHPYVANSSIQKMLLTGDQKEECLEIKASGKLILLDAMLSEMKKRGSKVLLLIQVTGDGSGRDILGNILDDFLCQRFGPDSYGRIDAAVAPSEKKSALDKFNKEQGRFVLLLEKRACLPSIKLSSLDAIILYDSDWIPMNDVRTLRKLTFGTQMEQINLFRLYSTCTMEEKVLILSSEGKVLDGNVQNIGPSTGRELLMWDASYLFAKLDEFQWHSSLTVDALEKSHLEDVLQEFMTILAQKSVNDEAFSISKILQVKLDGKIYHANHPLLAERKRQVKGEDLPHVFWKKKLEGRHPQSKFSSDLTPKKRRRVHYFDESQEKSDYKNAKVDEELVKVYSGHGHQDFLEGKDEEVSVRDKGDDKTMVHEGKKLYDSQQSMYNGIKPELAELCEVLHLPEDVKAIVGRFLEYVINNHRVSRNSKNFADAYQNDNMDTESKTWWQAFQISLCWAAASLVKHKIKHSETVVLAKKDLNYSCEKEDVDVAYSMLRCLKEMFLHHLQRPILLHSSQSTESHTKGVSTSISCSSSEPQNVNVDAETISVRKEISDWNGTLDSRSIPELQAAQRGLSRSIKWIEKKCNKKRRELLRRQKEENDDFRRKYEEEIASMERTKKAEEAVIRLHSSHLSINCKLKKLENEYMEKSNELRLAMDQKWNFFDAKQLAVRNKILNGRDNWIELVTSWAQTEMIKQPMISEHLPNIPVSETMSLPSQNVSQVVSSNDSIAPANLIESEQIRDVTRLSMPDGKVMLADVECILDILEDVTPVLPPSSDGSCNSSEQIPLEVSRNGASIFEGTDTSAGCSVEVCQQNEMRETVFQLPKVHEDAQEQNVASDVLGNTAPVLPPPSELEVSSISLSCSPTEENQLLITGSSPNGCDAACQWSEMAETISQVYEVQKKNAPKKQSLAPDMGNMALVLPPSFEEEVPSVSLSCSPTKEDQLVRTGSSPKGCGVEACQCSGMRESVSQVYVIQENNAPKEQSVAQHVTINMVPALSTSSEEDVPSLSHSCSPTHEIQLGRSSSPSISEGGDTNVRCGFEIFRSNKTLETVHLVSEVQEDIPQEQNLGENLGNITHVIPLASQNEVPCVSHTCTPTEEIQFGTGSSLVISEGNHVNTGGVIEVRKHNLTRDTVSQEKNVLLVPNAQSALSPCNLGPQLTEQTSLVQNVPYISEDCSSPSNQVPQNLSSLASAISEELAEDVSNINAQTTSQEVQTSLSHAAACLIDVRCRDPEILTSEPEGMQDLVSRRTHLLDLPSVYENSPHGVSHTTQHLQACRQLVDNQIELPNEDVLSPPRNATIPSGSSSHYMSNTYTTSSQTPLRLSDDPLQNEIESIRQEREKNSKTCEDTRLQLISDYNKEIGQILKKYEAKLKENQSGFLIRNSELDTNYSLALRNKVLADSFRMQCKDSEAFQLVGSYHVTNSSTLEHQVQFSSEMVAPAANLQRNLQPTPQTMDHRTQFIKHRSQVLSDAPTRSPCSNSVYVPVRNIPAEMEIHGPIATLQDKFAHSPQMIHHHLLSMQPSSQMSPSIPARPTFVNSVCLNAGNALSRSAIYGPAPHLQSFRFPAIHIQPGHSNPPAALAPPFQTSFNPSIQGMLQNVCQPLGANRLQDPSVYTLTYAREICESSDARPNLQTSSVHRGLELPASVQQGPRRTPSTLQSSMPQQSQSANVVCISDEE